MTVIASMSAIELAGYVCEHLRVQGIDVVLSGGACVAHDSNGRYVSLDLDFIQTGFTRRGEIAEAMAAIGFRPDGRHFRHTDSDYVVEF